MACTFRTLFLATLATASVASSQCKDGTCEGADPVGTGSALLQTKKSTANVKTHAWRARAPLAAAHIVESHACIPGVLQEAHLSAIRHHASLLATGTRTSVQQPELTSGMWTDEMESWKNTCTGKTHGDACTVMKNQQPVPGKCSTQGEDKKQWCEIGQFESCAKWNVVEGASCNVMSMTGICKQATGRLEWFADPLAGKSGTVTVPVLACSMHGEATLVLPGATPDPQPDPQPESGTTGAGSTATLDNAGFRMVTSLCCPPEMESFFNRLLDSMGLQVCSKPHIQGLMHWFTCVPDMDFQYVLDVINNGNPCKYWGAKGAVCPSLTPQCQGTWCR